MLTCVAFSRRPAHFSGYINPRFVAPVIIWMAYFMPVIVRPFVVADGGVYQESRAQYQNLALCYALLCITAFWLGFVLPLRPKWPAKITRNISPDLNAGRLRTMALVVPTVTALFMFYAQGLSLLDKSWAPAPVVPEWVAYLEARLVLPLNVIAVALYGLGWPARESRWKAATWLGAIYVIFMASVPFSSSFSRGTGLIPMFMLFAYIGRWHRIPIFVTLLAICYLVYSGHVGLTGRGIYGHYAGELPYWSHFFSGADFSAQSSGSAALGGDGVTPLSVAMAVYYENAYVGQLTPLQWIVFQLPVPHIGSLTTAYTGFGGAYTLDLTWFVGGHGSWGFTPTMLGDTFIHLGWWGCLPFVIMGMAYRVLENTIKSYGEQYGQTNILALTVLPTAYCALALGCFNSYRIWVSMFTFGIGLIVVLLWALKNVVHQRTDDFARDPELDFSADPTMASPN